MALEIKALLSLSSHISQSKHLLRQNFFLATALLTLRPRSSAERTQTYDSAPFQKSMHILCLVMSKHPEKMFAQNSGSSCRA